MSGMDNLVMIVAVQAREAVERIPESSLEDRARAAMRAVQNHWLVTSEDGQFKGAIAGLALACEGDERDQVTRSVRQLGRAVAILNALQADLPLDLGALTDEAESDENQSVLQLHKIWNEVRAESIR